MADQRPSDESIAGVPYEPPAVEQRQPIAGVLGGGSIPPPTTT